MIFCGFSQKLLPPPLWLFPEELVWEPLEPYVEPEEESELS